MPVQKIRTYLFNFFHFNKQERNGVFVLCLIIIVLFTFRLAMPLMHKGDNQVHLIAADLKPSQKLNDVELTNIKESKHEVFVSGQRFVFNPNTVTLEDAQKLGFSKKLSSTLINFRSKGGKFFKPEDLKKLYGLSPRLYNELESYILIPQKEYKHDSVFASKSRVYEKKTFTKELVEINSADSLSIVFLKGIGPGFTKRIIKYRSMLGGFHSIHQLKEVYGMTDSLYITLSSQIKLDATNLTKMPINAIDFNSLRKHPYFNFQTAQAIINFRSKHGKMTDADIKNLGIFSEEQLKVSLPYLSY
jgi:competence protein ComEA